MSQNLKQKVGKDDIIYMKIGSGEPLLFLHGFALGPDAYTKIYDGLKDDYEIIAPMLYGTPYLDNHPSTLDDLVSMTFDFTDALKLGKHHLMGYSTGGGISYLYATDSSDTNDVIGIDPLFPTGYDPLEFVKRALKGSYDENPITEAENIKDCISKTKDIAKVFIPYMKNIFGDLKSQYKLVKSIGDFSFDDIDVKQPSMLIYGDNDEFFEMNETIKNGLDSSFSDLTIKELPGHGHKWPLFHPGRAAREIRAYYKKLEKAGKGF